MRISFTFALLALADFPKNHIYQKIFKLRVRTSQGREKFPGEIQTWEILQNL